MRSLIRGALVVFTLLTLITGVLYPLAMTGVAQALFPQQANGSQLVVDGQVVGSTLIGQPFADPAYFWGRLSATAPFAYNSAAASGSNLGALNPARSAAAAARVAALQSADPANSAPIPIDLVTASGSGLDPHISPAAALYQVERVARARGLSPELVRQLVEQHTEGRQLGILGEPRVNVLLLNRALDALTAAPAAER